MPSSRLHTHRNDPLGVGHYTDAGDSMRQAFIKSSRALDAFHSARTDAYLFRVELPTLSPPTIWRTVRVLSNLTFHKLHKVLQIAFGWENQHAYQFRVYSGKAVHDDMILSIQDNESTFESREAWEDGQGNELKPRDERYLAAQTRLTRVLGNKKLDTRGLTVIYEYDLGDGWEHKIEFLGIAEQGLDQTMLQRGVKPGQQSFCLGGGGHPCAEDCGGECGWERTKTSLARRGAPWRARSLALGHRLGQSAAGSYVGGDERSER